MWQLILSDWWRFTVKTFCAKPVSLKVHNRSHLESILLSRSRNNLHRLKLCAYPSVYCFRRISISNGSRLSVQNRAVTIRRRGSSCRVAIFSMTHTWKFCSKPKILQISIQPTPFPPSPHALISIPFPSCYVFIREFPNAFIHARHKKRQTPTWNKELLWWLRERNRKQY